MEALKNHDFLHELEVQGANGVHPLVMIIMLLADIKLSTWILALSGVVMLVQLVILIRRERRATKRARDADAAGKPIPPTTSDEATL